MTGEELEALAPAIRSQIAQMGVPSQDVEDLTQDALLKMWRYRDSLDPDRPVQPWAYVVTRRIVFDHQRRMGTRPRPLSLDDALPEGDDDARSSTHAAQLLGVDPHPLDRIESEDEYRGLLRLVLGLPAAQQAVFALVDVLGLTYDDAGTTLGWPRSRVFARLHAARLALREQLCPS